MTIQERETIVADARKYLANAAIRHLKANHPARVKLIHGKRVTRMVITFPK